MSKGNHQTMGPIKTNGFTCHRSGNGCGMGILKATQDLAAITSLSAFMIPDLTISLSDLDKLLISESRPMQLPATMTLHDDATSYLLNHDDQVQSDMKSSAKMWDINDTTLPLPVEVEPFQDWPNGHCRYVYSEEESEDARRHCSGWAMRNTNNHNVNILKKSCLGVLVCTLDCVSDEGGKVHFRPAICDKARKKQIGRQCPNHRCPGRLELQPCRGHCGYPVTHFWRHVDGLIFFQAKGVHDHPFPEAKTSADTRRHSTRRTMAKETKMKSYDKKRKHLLRESMRLRPYTVPKLEGQESDVICSCPPFECLCHHRPTPIMDFIPTPVVPKAKEYGTDTIDGQFFGANDFFTQNMQILPSAADHLTNNNTSIMFEMDNRNGNFNTTAVGAYDNCQGGNLVYHSPHSSPGHSPAPIHPLAGVMPKPEQFQSDAERISSLSNLLAKYDENVSKNTKLPPNPVKMELDIVDGVMQQQPLPVSPSHSEHVTPTHSPSPVSFTELKPVHKHSKDISASMQQYVSPITSCYDQVLGSVDFNHQAKTVVSGGYYSANQTGEYMMPNTNLYQDDLTRPLDYCSNNNFSYRSFGSVPCPSVTPSSYQQDFIPQQQYYYNNGHISPSINITLGVSYE